MKRCQNVQLGVGSEQTPDSIKPRYTVSRLSAFLITAQ